MGCGHRSGDKKWGEIGVDLMKGKCDIQANAHYLPFRNAVFDKIYLMGILEHLVDPCRCVEEVKRVGKAGAIIHIELPQITSMAKWRLRKAIMEFPIGVLAAYRSLKYQRTYRHKDLGHKTIVTPRWIAKHFEIIVLRKEGDHTWFTAKTGKLLWKLGLKDRTRMDRWRILARMN